MAELYVHLNFKFIDWNEVSKSLIISLDIPTKFIDSLNENKKIGSIVARNLNKIYRYDGRFEFVDVYIPF